MKIARPMLLITTPVGVLWAIVEAWRFHWWLAVLLTSLITVISLFIWLTVRYVRRDQAGPAASASRASQRS